MSRKIKERLDYLVRQTLGSLSFIRIIEWSETLKLLNPQKGETILDVACGRGELSLKIARGGCEVCGIDLSPESLRMARLLNQDPEGKRFLVADAEHLPHKDCYFDKLICSSALEHFNDDNLALTEMRRVLRENGDMVITVDSLSYPLPAGLKEKHKRQYSVINYYKADEIMDKLDHAGFKVYSYKYLFNSPITSFFCNLHFLTHGLYRRNLLFLFGIIFIPLMMASDSVIGRKNCGYTLIVKASKK